MEQNRIDTPEAATDEPAFPATQEQSLPEQLVSPSLNPAFRGAPAFTPGEGRARRCRHDGWTPERQTAFLEYLAECGVVADACKRVGLSAQSAYAFRNRRSGRAFATAWDAVLVHRARGRLGDEVLSRAINGCIEAVHRDGEIVGERHRFDNRLSMAVLTRLDKLAERESAREQQLRAVSEDLDDLLDCIEDGGDAEAFVDSRRPKPTPDPAAELRLEERVWTGSDGRLWTTFPPPEGFEGAEEGSCGDGGFYARTLTEREYAALEARDAAGLVREARDRDLYFGFSGDDASLVPPSPEQEPPAAAGPHSDPRNPARSAGSPQSSTSSTYRDSPAGGDDG